MKKILKRLLIAVGITLALLLIAIIVITNLFEEQVGRQVVSEVNQQITTELRVEGFGLSFLSSFPNIGANLEGVELDDTEGKLILKAEEISFRAGLLSLLSSNVKIKSVVISGGELNVEVDRNGKTNTDIFVESSEETTEGETSSGSAIDLKGASLKDMIIRYVNKADQQDIRLQVAEANVAGQFGSDEFQLNSDAELQVDLVAMDEERYVVNQPLVYDAQVKVNTTTGLYELSGVEVTLGELPLAASGSVQMGGEESEYDLQLSSKGGSLAAVLQLLPGQYKEQIAGIDTRGDFQLVTLIKGTATATKNPEINTELKFSDGRISGDRMDGSIKDLSFVATYTNGERQDNRSSVFEVNNLTGYFQRERFEMRLRVTNFDDPDVDFAADGAIGMGMLAGFIPDERVTGGEGEVELQGLRLKGRYQDMIRTNRIGRVTLGGALVFDDAGFTVNGERLLFDRGQLLMDGNTLRVEGLKFEGPGTEMEFMGSASNLIPVLFADSLNSKNAELKFSAELVARELDIDQLVALGAPSEEAVEAAEAAGQADSLAQAEVERRAFTTQFLNGTFKANIESYNYGEIEGTDFTGDLTFLNNNLHIEGNTQAMGGEFILDADMEFKDEPRLTAKLTCNAVDIYEFFRQSENFGQDVLVADNLSGSMDARIFIEAFFDAQGNFLEDKLRVLAGLGLKDGELKDFAMLEDFSTFVNIRDLREIRFTNLENFFEVRDRRLFIPVMFIQSNALNLTISGEHSFDQEIAYHLKVNAGQVLTNRFKRHDSQLQPKPAQRRGFFNLYYAILGSIDQYNFKSDKRRVQSDFELSDLRKRDIRDKLEREFRTVIELVDEPLDWRDIPEYQQDIDEDNPEFLDEIEGGIFDK